MLQLLEDILCFESDVQNNSSRIIMSNSQQISLPIQTKFNISTMEVLKKLNTITVHLAQELKGKQKESEQVVFCVIPPKSKKSKKRQNEFR